MRPMLYRICAVAVASWLGCGTVYAAENPGAGAPAAGAIESAAPVEQILFDKLRTEIAELDRSFDGVLGVAITDLRSGQQILRNADRLFPTASSIKIAILAELFHQEQESARGQKGMVRLDGEYVPRREDLIPDSPIVAGLSMGISRVTNRDLATFMIVVSDNTATNLLIDRLGMDAVNGFLTSLGLPKTRLRRKMLDGAAVRRGLENTATPRELALLLGKLQGGQMLDAQRTAELLYVLSLPKQSYLTAEIPDEVPVACKLGSLDGVRTDSGIFQLKNRPFVISVMTTFAQDGRAAEAVIARIAGAAYRVFARLDGSTALGRRVP